ncbi:hypothetical protein ThrDRAFT_04268 [Frankia casuarinae]|uniref:Phosphoenolpyruvate synthase n=1 Tax=Frankia casuarinae (strain DSM 45818 / CECT 9043 / HFP020203 / CcI3) TaxID=106370 RepID=Q2J9J2_FRACC|nr:PEP/pyruvate-binding domain-containing protein [Frankia casuarinae]ABD12050.1 phosphoenolpyruvate synthase [Frankia casuarinae]EYT90098.1 hypothetical protein ThrDRAFT_04268 [Frankia casuarinae]
MRDVRPLRELRSGDRDTVGAKAANLGELISAGFPVPDGFCLPQAVYHRTVGDKVRPLLAQLDAALTEDATDDQIRPISAAMRATVEATDVPAGLAADVAQALAAWRIADVRVSVRSSATWEDTDATSFAGQYRSELGVPPAAVLDSVRRCWGSLWELPAIRYRQRHGIPHGAVGMSVIVQLMAEAEAAGVLFTVDPRDAAADRLVIEATWGFGEALVSGKVDPDRFDVDRSGATLRHAHVADKRQMVAYPSHSGAGGVDFVDVPDQRRRAPSLTAEQVAELASLGRAIETHFGAPQDVEWAVSGTTLTILQARPIRLPAADEPPPPAADWTSPIEGAWWARISICDSWLPEPLSPLFASTLFPCLVRHWQRNWAGPDSAQRNNRLLPTPMTGVINGFAYLRFDYHLNRYPRHAAAMVLRFFRFHLGPLRRQWQRGILPRHSERIEAANRRDLTRLDNNELLGLIDGVQELSGRYWGIIGGLAWYWNVSEWLLATVYPWVARAGTGAGLPIGPGPLLQGYPSRTLDVELELAELARHDADGAEYTAEFERFIGRQGHQVYSLDFASPTPAEDPEVFRATIEAYRSGTRQQPQERIDALAAQREDRLRTIRKALRFAPVRRGVLHLLLRWNLRQGRLRDEVLFHFTRGWPVLRRAYLELGRRLVAAGVLTEPDDVFYLTGDQVKRQLAALDTGVAGDDLTSVVHERRRLREQQRLLSPPIQVPQDARIFLGRRDVTALAVFGPRPRGAEDDGLRGSPVSPGRATAPARRISSTDDFGRLRPGEILVAPHLTPAWSPLLSIAAGVVTDTGGALSHGSIVAREYGVPAVMGVHGATHIIQDGQVVTVDGDRGLVLLQGVERGGRLSAQQLDASPR